MRNLTRQEERAIRLTHHDFVGLPKSYAALEMCISVSRLNQILRSVKRKAPQMFPILTVPQNDVFRLLDSGATYLEIADELAIDVKQVCNIAVQLHKLGVCIYHRPKTVSYNPSMDDKVVRRF